MQGGMKQEKKSLGELLKEALVPKEVQPYEVPGNWVWMRLKYTVSYNKNSLKKGPFVQFC